MSCRKPWHAAVVVALYPLPRYGRVTSFVAVLTGGRLSGVLARVQLLTKKYPNGPPVDKYAPVVNVVNAAAAAGAAAAGSSGSARNRNSDASGGGGTCPSRGGFACSRAPELRVSLACTCRERNSSPQPRVVMSRLPFIVAELLVQGRHDWWGSCHIVHRVMPCLGSAWTCTAVCAAPDGSGPRASRSSTVDVQSPNGPVLANGSTPRSRHPSLADGGAAAPASGTPRGSVVDHPSPSRNGASSVVSSSPLRHAVDGHASGAGAGGAVGEPAAAPPSSHAGPRSGSVVSAARAGAAAAGSSASPQPAPQATRRRHSSNNSNSYGNNNNNNNNSRRRLHRRCLHTTRRPRGRHNTQMAASRRGRCRRPRLLRRRTRPLLLLPTPAAAPALAQHPRSRRRLHRRTHRRRDCRRCRPRTAPAAYPTARRPLKTQPQVWISFTVWCVRGVVVDMAKSVPVPPGA